MEITKDCPVLRDVTLLGEPVSPSRAEQWHEFIVGMDYGGHREIQNVTLVCRFCAQQAFVDMWREVLKPPARTVTTTLSDDTIPLTTTVTRDSNVNRGLTE